MMPTEITFLRKWDDSKVMVSNIVIIPQGDDYTGFVGLSAKAKLPITKPVTGKLFKKQILQKGPFYYPGAKGNFIDVDDYMLDTLVTNFNNTVCDIVQVTKVDADNQHTEDPDYNRGEVVGLSREGDKLYAYVDAREYPEKFGKTYIGASAMLSMNYRDHRDGELHGPTLCHVAVTNRPHVLNLESFEEVIAASNVWDDSSDKPVFLTSAVTRNKESAMTLDELLSELKEDHDIDVSALQNRVAELEPAVALSAKIQDELLSTGILKLSSSEPTPGDFVKAVAGLVAENVELSSKIDEINESAIRAAATSEVDALIAKAFITPDKRDAMLELRLSNEELFKKLLPEAPVVKLSAEQGTDVEDEGNQNTAEDEIARLSSSPAAQRFIRA